MSDKPKLLAVDDERDNLTFLARALRRDFDVVVTEFPEEAIELCSLHNFAVIVSDQRMPVMDGVEFLSRILPRQPKSIRILLTGYSDYDAAVGAINRGHVDRYFTKPLDVNILREYLDEALRNVAIDSALQILYNRLQEENRLLKEQNHALKEELRKTRGEGSVPPTRDEDKENPSS